MRSLGLVRDSEQDELPSLSPWYLQLINFLISLFKSIFLFTFYFSTVKTS